MTSDRSYTVGHKEGPLAYLRRFRTAERCCGFFRQVVQADSRILDCGCGPGSITIGLAQWAPEGQTVGIDIGAEQLDGARALAHDLVCGPPPNRPLAPRETGRGAMLVGRHREATNEPVLTTIDYLC
jgi:SAM-dependent methyltransferase